MAITWSDVVLIAPELSGLASGTTDAILADVALQLDATTWGARLNIGSKYLAAHIATIAKRGGGVAGPVTSETVGPLSRDYAAPAVSSAYDTTAYGQEFQRLVRGLAAARIPGAA